MARRRQSGSTSQELTVLAGETRVTASGWVAPPGERRRRRGARGSTRRTPGSGRSVAARSRSRSIRSSPRCASCRSSSASSSTTSRRRARRSTARSRPRSRRTGRASRLKLRLDLRPSVTQDAMRLWPQFINPDVRDWASHNMHGGTLEGVMVAELVRRRPRRDGPQARRRRPTACTGRSPPTTSASTSCPACRRCCPARARGRSPGTNSGSRPTARRWT